jgi:hypothetical protein
MYWLQEDGLKNAPLAECVPARSGCGIADDVHAYWANEVLILLESIGQLEDLFLSFG